MLAYFAEKMITFSVELELNIHVERAGFPKDKSNLTSNLIRKYMYVYYTLKI